VALFRPTAAPSPPAHGHGSADAHREFHLPAHATAVADARDKVCRQLNHWGLPDDLGYTAQLVISEFFTNAVLHTDSEQVRCLLQICERWLRIEVTDEGSDHSEVAPREAAEEDVNGRGLQLVSAVAEQWGVHAGGRQAGRVVWAELSLAQP
jgi:anti-sigma regulatory factor (Ser/Thr protein kinase)